MLARGAGVRALSCSCPIALFMSDPATTPAPATRRRKTSRRVHLMDKVSSTVITLGGMLVVVSVLGIAVYLIGVTAPLFAPGRIEPAAASVFAAHGGSDDAIIMLDTDESRVAAIRLTADGVLDTIKIATGEVLLSQKVIPDGATLTAFVRAPRDGHVALGYSDGTIQIGTIGFTTEFLSSQREPAELNNLAIGEARAFGGGIAERTPIGQVRLTRPAIDLAAPTPLRTGDGAVIRLDFQVGASQRFIAAMREDGSLAFNDVRTRPNLGGGPARVTLRTFEIPAALIERSETPMRVDVLGDGHSVLLIWEDGFAERISMANAAEPILAEKLQLVAPGRRITAISKMIGGQTMIIGDSAGGVTGWFAARNELGRTPDKREFVPAHPLTPQAGAITSIDVSTRDRTFITGDETGVAWVRNMTAETLVATIEHSSAEPIVFARLTPKTDGVILMNASGQAETWTLDAPHADASVKALFGKVWYEGDPAPSYNYQSSSGDDAAEAKYNLVPLIFGTLKATIYTMLIAAPLGILGAIYTSEFLSARVRTAIKPSIEMMASLPSVVLGFIAAMLLAPMIRDALPGVILAFAAVPFGVLLAAHIWHFAPVRLMSRLSAGGRLAMIIGVTLLAGFVSIRFGSVMESILFRPSQADVLIRAGSYETVERDEWPEWFAAVTSVSDSDSRRLREDGLAFREGNVVRAVGDAADPALAREIEIHGYADADLRAWLDGVIGGAWPGWFVLAFPASAILVALLLSRFVNPAVRAWDREHSPAAEAGVELIKFLLAVGATAVAAAIGATALTSVGLDPRDSIFGTFGQRNTLVVGIAMAVAVIPIIYTISDDAMTSVPDSLRSASLGAGATTWQTAVRVVLPVALSGVFSACMIGLGRAAGETMIVLMATGNTPIMSWSIFDGLRTLSANIAVELPEAPKDGTHYRVLFLCGLALFAMTFTVNTAAEIVRQRVRKRSASL